MRRTRPFRIAVLLSVLALLGSYPSGGRTQKSVVPTAEDPSKTPKATAAKEARMQRAGDLAKQILPASGAATAKMSGPLGARLGGADIAIAKMSGQSGLRLGGAALASAKMFGQLGSRLGGAGTTTAKTSSQLAFRLGGESSTQKPSVLPKENVPSSVVPSDTTQPSDAQISPKDEKADTSKSSKDESTASQRPPIPLVLGIISLLAATLVGAVLGMVFAKMRSAAQRASIEAEIAALLGEKSIHLATLPETLRKVEERFREAGNELRDKIKDITEVNAGYAEQLQQSPHDMYQIKCAAAIGSVDDALDAIAAARNDADFDAVETALGLRANLQQTRERLSALPKTSEVEFFEHLLAALENGNLDHVLSTAGFFDAYFSERQDWRQLRVAYRSIEALLVSMVEANQVRVIQTPVLSIVDAAEMADGQFSDRRNVRAIPVVRQSAARIARDLGPGEFLVVDCLAPGWFSSGPAGRRQPRFAVFEVSTWT